MANCYCGIGCFRAYGPTSLTFFSLSPSFRHLSGAPLRECPCVIGFLLDVDAACTTVFVDGEPLEVQRPCKFPNDGRAWYPRVSIHQRNALHSCTN